MECAIYSIVQSYASRIAHCVYATIIWYVIRENDRAYRSPSGEPSDPSTLIPQDVLLALASSRKLPLFAHEETTLSTFFFVCFFSSLARFRVSSRVYTLRLLSNMRDLLLHTKETSCTVAPIGSYAITRDILQAV